jgi:orotidine-5'-phosphate decarboxylase
MDRNDLTQAIKARASFLSIGLDSDISRLPRNISQNAAGILEFNKRIIDATAPYCVAYKLNTAFYEALGAEGWKALEATINFIPSDKFIIADAKRGDIGNTSHQYANAFFEQLHCDAVTVAPFMGRDSVEPFLEHPGKWAIVLGLTSNTGSRDFQLLETNGGLLYEEVVRKVASWGTADNTMFVIGATQPHHFHKVREIIPDHFLLVPGVGQQGGSLEEVARNGLTKDVGLMVNASRSIIFSSQGSDFAKAAGHTARKIQLNMKAILEEKGF